MVVRLYRIRLLANANTKLKSIKETEQKFPEPHSVCQTNIEVCKRMLANASAELPLTVRECVRSPFPRFTSARIAIKSQFRDGLLNIPSTLESLIRMTPKVGIFGLFCEQYI